MNFFALGGTQPLLYLKLTKNPISSKRGFPKTLEGHHLASMNKFADVPEI